MSQRKTGSRSVSHARQASVAGKLMMIDWRLVQQGMLYRRFILSLGSLSLSLCPCWLTKFRVFNDGNLLATWRQPLHCGASIFEAHKTIDLDRAG